MVNFQVENRKVSDHSSAPLKISHSTNALIMLGPYHFTLFCSSIERNIYNKTVVCIVVFFGEVENG